MTEARWSTVDRLFTRALEQPPEQVRQRSRDFLRHASQLASDVENLSHWEAAFRREDETPLPMCERNLRNKLAYK